MVRREADRGGWGRGIGVDMCVVDQRRNGKEKYLCEEDECGYVWMGTWVGRENRGGCFSVDVDMCVVERD